MPTIGHKNLTEVDLHEEKGASSATVGQTYIANGAGSGSWGTPIVGSDTVTDASIDWPNNKAASLQQYSPVAVNGVTYTQSTTAWFERDTFYIYKPSNSDNLSFYAEYEMTAGATLELEWRVKTDTVFGSTVQVPTTKTAISSTLDISDKSGWISITIETRVTVASSHTALMHQMVYYFI